MPRTVPAPLPAPPAIDGTAAAIRAADLAARHRLTADESSVLAIGLKLARRESGVSVRAVAREADWPLDRVGPALRRLVALGLLPEAPPWGPWPGRPHKGDGPAAGGRVPVPVPAAPAVERDYGRPGPASPAEACRAYLEEWKAGRAAGALGGVDDGEDDEP